MLNALFIGLGGFIGAVSRYYFSLLSLKLFPTKFPVGTLLINFIGAFLIGAVFEYSNKISPIHQSLYLFITIGMLGGFTTFSTFSLETFRLFEDGKIMLASINILASIVLCLLGVLIGKSIIR